MTERLNKLVTGAVLALFAGASFAGAGSVTAPNGPAATVAQAEPTPEFCKNNPKDPRCVDKEKKDKDKK